MYYISLSFSFLNCKWDSIYLWNLLRSLNKLKVHHNVWDEIDAREGFSLFSPVNMPASIVSKLFRWSVVPRGRECCFFVAGNISEILLILSVSLIIYFISIQRFSSSDNILDHTWFADNISDLSMCFHMWLVGINSFKLISCVCVALISVLLDRPAAGHPGGGFASSNLMPFKEACPTLGW